MRSKFHAYLNTLPKLNVASSSDYAAVLSSGLVVVASDAEVSLIAGHTTRLAWDTLLHTENSTFAASMYLIGMSKEWVFEGPFDTIPLDVGPAEEAKPVATSPEIAQANSTFIANLLAPYENATAAAA